MWGLRSCAHNLWKQSSAVLACSRISQQLPTQLLRLYSQASSSSEIYGACVLERLPIVQNPAPQWEAEYKSWSSQFKQDVHLVKAYPQPEGKRPSRSADAEDDFVPVPSTTPADESGHKGTMKRQLASKLVLLVKQQAAGGTPGSSWAFPHARHKAGETIRGTAERALRECIGVSQVYFIGNAPMAHLPLDTSDPSSSRSSSSSSLDPTEPSHSTGSRSKAPSPSGPAIFFHLAQVVNDPWEVKVKEGVASEHVWVTLEELPQYIQDARLLDLAKKML